MLTAVEPSADAIGAGLMRALRQRLGPETRFVGVGGRRMAIEGVQSPFDPSSLAIVGAFNAIAAYPRVRRLVKATAALARAERPDVAILIDAWGFNLRVAHALRRQDPRLPLIKYVAPQVWATRPGRARTLARSVDALLALHSFDASYFRAEGLETRVVGNPALVPPCDVSDGSEFRKARGIAPEAPVLLVLPGSRSGEVRRLAGPFRDAVRKLTRTRGNLVVVVAVADEVAQEVRDLIGDWTPSPVFVEGEADRGAAMRAATVGLACSGTVTSQLALAGCPMVVAYRLDPFTYRAAQLLIRTPYVALFNVEAQHFIAPERIQGRCTGAGLAEDLGRLLDDPKLRSEQAKAQLEAVERLRMGIDDPVGAAADAVVDLLARRG
ncbi:MAG: lipid-A-disaccharide synthase [Caulobacteraceae bacterium]|nr:lipid-A-disaccharide synthase [Caulobacteraceae bacterium]